MYHVSEKKTGPGHIVNKIKSMYMLDILTLISTEHDMIEFKLFDKIREYIWYFSPQPTYRSSPNRAIILLIYIYTTQLYKWNVFQSNGKTNK